MDIDAAISWIQQAQTFNAREKECLDEALAALDDTPPEPEPPIPPDATTYLVATPAEFDQALAAAVAGDTLLCTVDLVYTGAVAITTAGLTIKSDDITTPPGRMTREAPAPTFRAGITISADTVRLEGLEIRRENKQDIVVVTGGGVTLDRCRILGDPVNGAKRGIAANGPGLTITRCYIDDCFGPYPGNDCQAIMGWLSEGPTTIVDNYVCGGTESIMFGGGDPPSEADCPCDILIRGNTITKQPAWQTQAISCKNVLELKNARRVRILDNEISYSWGGHGQDGYLLMLTPRNQDGRAPYSTVEDVEIRNNRFRCGAAAINLLGRDNNAPSGRLSRIMIVDNWFEQLDPKLYTGSNKMILISDGPLDVLIDNNDFAGVNIGSVIYFTGSPQSEQLIVTNNVFPSSKYGVFGNNSSTGINSSTGNPKAWDQYVASGTYSGNTTTPPAADDGAYS